MEISIMSEKRLPQGEPMAIAVRAFVRKADQDLTQKRPQQSRKKVAGPSEWVLVFDTETTTDAAQKFRFGTYQVRKSDELDQAGIFYDPRTLSKREQALLSTYAQEHQLKLLSVEAFINDIFYGIGYFCRATIVGFNLPFDISRLAIEHATARSNKYNKIMAGGFSFELSNNPNHPRVQIKHISSRDAFIQFTAPRGQRTSRGKRKKRQLQAPRRGFFVDCKTLAAALTSQSHSLASLAQVLRVEAQKLVTEDHGRSLTPEYIEYAVQDTKTTWECYDRLKSLYELHGLELTEVHNIHSEASLGKAYLREMGIEPWRQLQPDFPDEILGYIMNAYFGGRSEVHIRKVATQVLYTDFLSMYPTVCTLMGLWRFVTAKGMTWRDSTDDTKQLLNEIKLSDLQQSETWRSLCTLVQVIPDADIFPVRARYGGDAQYTIGSNYLTSETPHWLTLADCISSSLLTGKVPNIVKAITFEPEGMQDGLKPVNVAGNKDYLVDPCEGDFFKRVIDLRRSVKAKMKGADPQEKSALDNQQLALKILANATSYGIFVELNTESEKQFQLLHCYGHSGKAIPIKQSKFEATGKYFHPLLAALITGAARLMLATTEHLACDAGLDWAFCDTDSMALAKPEGMSQEVFFQKSREVQEWFTPLNPYSEKAPLLKIEEYNYDLSDSTKLEPLYCLAISSKRYALFNLDEKGQIILRKVSAHGLGHLLAPYHRSETKVLEGALPWQQDLWREIIQASLNGQQPDYGKLQNHEQPAVSRYGATTPALLKWCKGYNENKPYIEQIKPFNFLLVPQANHLHKSVKPIGPYHKNPVRVLPDCFDRETGEKINKKHLKSNLETVAQYHLHPETKFLNGDYTDHGITNRRHILVKSIRHIGKEANKWEEQFFTGFNSDAQIEYGIDPDQIAEILESIVKAINEFGVKRMAESAGLSRRYVSDIYNRKITPSESAISKLNHAVKALEYIKKKEDELRNIISRIMAEWDISIRELANQLGIDHSNLSKIISGHRGSIEYLEYMLGYIRAITDIESTGCLLE